jgi:hypothetical protein
MIMLEFKLPDDSIRYIQAYGFMGFIPISETECMVQLINGDEFKVKSSIDEMLELLIPPRKQKAPTENRNFDQNRPYRKPFTQRQPNKTFINYRKNPNRGE